jgi:putative peptide zinc metalloprotease protein
MPVAPPAAIDVERRKKVRIRLRRDLIIAPQKYEGRTYYVVKDPVSLRYYRFKEQEHYLIQLMDGSYTLDDAQKQYEKRFRPERLTLEDLEGFAQQLLTAGLAHNESPQAGKQLFDRRKKRRRSEWMQALTNILYIKIPIYDPDKLLDWMLPRLRWIFTTWFMFASIALFMSAVMLVATHFETFRDKLPSYHEFFSFGTVAYLWAALGVVKVIHEFGHGLSCKAFGGEVHEMGALFLVFSPCLYCNVSDAWTLPSKWKRIIISFAGIYVELIIAAIATWVWWNTPAQPFVNNMSLSLMVVCSVSTVVFNANPLMRYDGYYILADWLEIPNLRDRSNRFLQRLCMDYCLGIEVQPEQYMTLWRRVLFVLYAIISYIYRWVITFSILYFMSMFLKPYKLGVVSGMLALGAGASLVGWPLYRLGKNLHKRGRLPDMKAVRVTLSTLALTALILFLFLVPLPVSRVRQLGLVQVTPEALDKVYVPHPGGILEDLKVRDGEEVKKGQLLAVFRNLELELQVAQNRAERDRYNKESSDLAQLLSKQANVSDETRRQVQQQMAEARGKFYTAVWVVQELEKQQARLTEVFAPSDGIVMTPPHVDEIGKYFDKNTVLCSIGDPSSLRVMMPVPTADYKLLDRDLREVKDLAVTIRVQGHAEHTWPGKLLAENLPQTEAKRIPIPLTNKGGGNIAVRPATKSDPDGLVPQNQQYLVPIEFLKPDHSITPGTLAYVKVSCRYRTCAWWAWRAFSSAFDLGWDPTDLVPLPSKWRW